VRNRLGRPSSPLTVDDLHVAPVALELTAQDDD
jgi:hypothetical protein